MSEEKGANQKRDLILDIDGYAAGLTMNRTTYIYLIAAVASNKITARRKRPLPCLLQRITIDSGRYQRERDRVQTIVFCNRERTLICIVKICIFRTSA